MGKDTFVAPRAPTAAERRNGPDVLGAIFADNGRPTQVAVSQIRTDGGTQMRAGLDDSTVFEYTQSMIANNGWGEFPAVVAYHDGAAYWLADGFHRVQAYRDAFPDAGKTIPVEVRAGTRRDAILHAAGANANHGLRRTNADKRRAVETLLRDEEWAAWSNTEIARRCTVSESSVRNIRAELERASQIAKVTERHGADGKTYNTANIGTRPAPTVMNGGRKVEGRQYQGLDQLIEEIRTCVPQFYTEPHEQQKMAVDIMACANAKAGGFWKFVTTQTGNYLQSDLAQAMRIVSGEITARNRPAPKTVYTAPAEPPAAVLNTAPPSVPAAVEEAAVHQPVVYTYEEIRQTAGDHVARGVAARQPDDEAIDHPLDCYDDNGAPAAGKMRDLWELRALLQDVRDQKAREYAKLTSLEVPAVLAITLTRMIDNLTAAMDAFQTELETNHANQ